MAKVYKRGNAALFDIPVEAIEDRLAENLPWLDTIFGKCERLAQKNKDGKVVFTPNWFVKDNDYIKVMPDDRILKNMAFFTLEEPVRLLDSGKYSVGFSLIIWGDMRKVDTERNIELVKAQVIKATRVANPAIGHVAITDIYEKSENVWRGFTIEETDAQFMMQPYFAIRVNGTLYMNAVCR